MKNRPGHRGNHRSAVVAGIALPRRIAVVFAFHFAVVAEGDVARATLLHQPIKAGIAIGKLSIKLLNRVSSICWD